MSHEVEQADQSTTAGRGASEAPTCKVVKAAARFAGKQGLHYEAGISAEAVGARGIHLQLVTIPPGARSRAHKHAQHETALYVLSGRAGMWFGEALEKHLVTDPGDYLYIPANVPHQPYNLSATEPCVAVIARTDPNEQESVVLTPELERADR